VSAPSLPEHLTGGLLSITSFSQTSLGDQIGLEITSYIGNKACTYTCRAMDYEELCW
jgi:hypothetical protein